MLRLVGGTGLGLASAIRGGSGIAAQPRSSSAAQPARIAPIPTWTTGLRELAPDVYVYTQGSGPGVDNASLSNAGVIAGPDGLMAIDALGPPVHAKRFRAAAEAATGKRFDRLVNTHHHRDHTNGNCFFRAADIVSHEFCRQAVIDQGLPARPYPDRPEWQEGMSELRLAPPTTTFSDRVTYRYGDIDVELRFVGPAHTWGDVVAYLPRHRILFAGDLAFFYVTPPAHNGHIAKWIEAIDRIDAMDVDLIVPGHGPVGGTKELAETRAYLALVARETRLRFDAGMRPGEAAADIDVGRFAAWTNPERTAWNAVRLYADFAGTLTPAQDLAAQNRAVAEYAAIRAGRAP
jgi:cyclase